MPERIAPLVPLIEFRHRSWMEPAERADTLAFLEQTDLAYVSVDAPMTRASNVIARHAAATHRVAYVRFHGRNAKTWNIRGRLVAALRLDVHGGGAGRMGRDRGLTEHADEVYAMFNNNRDDFAPRSAMILRDLLDRAGIPAPGASSRRRSPRSSDA